jgi:RNA polymerase sigma-70 factor (ECF subfamily)
LFFRAKIQLESFEAAAMPHLTDLHRTASFLLRDPHEAEDLIQETYLEAWKSFHRFELGTNCRAWLFKIMFHRLHHVRRRLLKTSRVITIDAPEGQDELAAAAVSALRPRARNVVELVHIQGHSIRETAQILGISTGAVKARMFHAKIALHRMPLLQSVGSSNCSRQAE